MAQANVRQTSRDRKHFHELVRDFQNAMLITRTREGAMRARPMFVAEIEPTGDIWFVTDVEAPKIGEIGADDQVSVTMQSDQCFVSVSGRAHVIRDRPRVQRLWKETWRSYFPGGPDSADLVLVKVEATTGEYWDDRGVRGLRFLFDAARQYLRGERAEETHGKVQLH